MRGKRAPKRKIDPDSVYKSLLVSKLVNRIMQHGKKAIAEKTVYTAFDKIKEKTKKDPLEVFNEAISKIQPAVELRSRRVGGANYQVPIPVTQERGSILALRWLVEAARAKKGIPMADKLTNEILLAIKGEGAAITKKENTHKMAEANKAFAIFRW